MADTPDVNAVEESDDYYHVQFRDPDEFDQIRTPDWAEDAAGSVSDGAEVRTGRVEGDDEWEVESVLIDVDEADGEDDARDQAEDVVEKIRS